MPFLVRGPLPDINSFQRVVEGLPQDERFIRVDGIEYPNESGADAMLVCSPVKQRGEDGKPRKVNMETLADGIEDNFPSLEVDL